MRQVVIENPVINSPFEEPHRHFRFDDEGILIYAIEDVLAGKFSPRATIATDGVPTAVCLKILPDRRVWVIAGKNAPTVHVLDGQTGDTNPEIFDAVTPMTAR